MAFPGQTASQDPAPAAKPSPTMTPEEQRKKAQEQLEQEEHQRVWAVVATFNTTANREAAPLSPGQKFQLFFRSASDPWPFLLASVLAGIGRRKQPPGIRAGRTGRAKRFGAEYGDYFIGNFLGNAVLASLWHEDPRYYQRGHGSYVRRALWAATGTVWCKRDNGTWGPNYANVVGNLSGRRSLERLLPAVRSDGWEHNRTGLLCYGTRHYRLGSHRILAGHRAPPSAKTGREAGSERRGGSCTLSSHDASTLAVTLTLLQPFSQVTVFASMSFKVILCRQMGSKCRRQLLSRGTTPGARYLARFWEMWVFAFARRFFINYKTNRHSPSL